MRVPTTISAIEIFMGASVRQIIALRQRDTVKNYATPAGWILAPNPYTTC